MTAKKTTAKKTTAKKPPKVVADEGETTDQLPARTPMDAETASAVLAADAAEAAGEAWPEEITLTLLIGDDPWEWVYKVSPVDEVLDFIQMAFLLDSDNSDRMRSFIQGVMAPGEYEEFVKDMKSYMVECKRRGAPVKASEFFEQVSEQIFNRFNMVVTPKDGQPSTGRRRTGRPLNLPR